MDCMCCNKIIVLVGYLRWLSRGLLKVFQEVLSSNPGWGGFFFYREKQLFTMNTVQDLNYHAEKSKPTISLKFRHKHLIHEFDASYFEHILTLHTDTRGVASGLRTKSPKPLRQQHLMLLPGLIIRPLHNPYSS